MSKKKFFRQIEIKNPCSQDWETMHGNDIVRFCDHCTKDVTDISTFSLKEAVRLVRRSNGSICLRYRVDPKRRTPVLAGTLYQITSRAGIAAGALTASIAFSTAAYSQSETPQPQQVEIAAQLNSNEKTNGISGYVTDPNGAVIPYALVSLINEQTGEYRTANSSAEGFYEFSALPTGTYKIKFEAGGFEAAEIAPVELSDSYSLRRDAQLALPQVQEVVQVGATDKADGNWLGGVVVSIENSNPLVAAAMRDDLEDVKARVMMGARVNSRDRSYSGISPLHAAVESGDLEMIQFLLDRGAKPNIRDYQKRTPLMMMDEDAIPEIFDLLIRYGAKVNLVDKEGNTALHHLAEYGGKAEIIRLLISHGADVRSLNKERQTALAVASENNDPENVKALLEAGSDVNAVNSEGETAWELTDSNEIKALLETYGAITRVK